MSLPESEKGLIAELKPSILQLLLNQPLSIEELAKKLGMETSAIRHHVRRLKDTGYVKEAEYQRGKVGRPVIKYKAIHPVTATSLSMEEIRNMMWLHEFFRRPVITVSREKLYKIDKNASVRDAAEIMKDNNVGSVIVTDGGKPVGIVTERDILYKVSAKGLPPSNVKIKEVMSSPIITLPSNADILDALEMMAKYQVRRLVTVTDGEPSGIVAQRFIVDALIAESSTRHLKKVFKKTHLPTNLRTIRLRWKLAS